MTRKIYPILNYLPPSFLFDTCYKYVFSIIIALKIFVKLTEKNTCANLFCNKVADPALVIFFKTRSRHRCLPVHFVNFLRASFEFCEFTCEFCKFSEFSEQLFHRTPPDDCFRKLSNFDQYTLLEKEWFQRFMWVKPCHVNVTLIWKTLNWFFNVNQLAGFYVGANWPDILWRYFAVDLKMINIRNQKL